MKTLFWAVLWGIPSTFFQCRFLKKMLGAKYHYTYVWFYLGSLIYGQANVMFSLAGTQWGNLIYLCICAFGLNMLLFHGSVVKKSFFTLWMYCVPEVAFFALYPLFFAAAGGQDGCLGGMLDALSIISRLMQFLMMEILQQRLHVLKRDFTNRDAVYFMYIILFIYAALAMQQNMFVSINDWTAEILFAVAVPCSLIAFAGLGLYIGCIVMLEKRLLEWLAKQQYQMLGRHLEASREQYEHQIKIRHDMKNHGLCLTQLLADGKTEEALRYLEQWNSRMEQGENIIQSGSVFVDALLNPKYQQAKEFGIDISIQMSAPKEEDIAPVDLCCILANALDNAIEACQRGIKEGKPAGWIRVKSQMHANYWVLEIRNSNDIPAAEYKGKNSSGATAAEYKGKLLSSKRTGAYGVGLQNIRTVVGRYDGVLDLQNGTCFTLSVMLPLKYSMEKITRE